jgi:HSP20 family molecular chaperone IbpA
MNDTQNLKLQEKKELEVKEEKTVQGKHYVPYTDIYETADALTVVMEIPGVGKDAIDIQLEKDELTVNARINLENYASYEPVYTEYNIGHFTRSFILNSKVNRERIEASVADGVLTLTLPKEEVAKPKKIKIN